MLDMISEIPKKTKADSINNMAKFNNCIGLSLFIKILNLIK